MMGEFGFARASAVARTSRTVVSDHDFYEDDSTSDVMVGESGVEDYAFHRAPSVRRV